MRTVCVYIYSILYRRTMRICMSYMYIMRIAYVLCYTHMRCAYAIASQCAHVDIFVSLHLFLSVILGIGMSTGGALAVDSLCETCWNLIACDQFSNG